MRALYYYERERRKWIGGREGKRKGFAGPMSKCFLRPCSADVRGISDVVNVTYCSRMMLKICPVML